MKIRQIMGRKRFIIVLGLLLGANGMFGMSFARKMAKPAFITALAAGSGYQMHCEAKKQAIPSYFTKVLPGVTAGFDHIKFEKLKKKHLDAVNRELEDFIDNQPQEQERQLLAFPFDGGICDVRPQIDLKAASDFLCLPENYLLIADVPREMKLAENFTSCDKSIDPEVCDFILKRLQRHGVDSKCVMVVEKLSNDDSTMSVYRSKLNPDRVLLEVDPVLNQRILLDSNQFKRFNTNGGIRVVLFRHFLEQIVGHEACHIIYNDGIYRAVSHLRKEYDSNQTFEINKIREKRADIFGVFNSSNPIGTALLINTQHVGGLYVHRGTTQLHAMAKDILGCYNGGLKEALELEIGNDGEKYKCVAIEHVEK